MESDAHPFGLTVTVTDTRGRRLRMSGLSRWLEHAAPARTRGTVSVALLSDRGVRALNLRYRRKDATTDVLSFPASSVRRRGANTRGTRRGQATQHAYDPESLLGDIVIARGVARRQAKEARHSELTELRILALHGLLHLLGYDHERDNGRMRRVETRLRRRMGLPVGLIERHA